MRAIVHIGMPKTGTTAIQQWLAENADALRKQGIGFERMSSTKRLPRAGHVELSFCAAEEADMLLRNGSLRRVYRVSNRDEQTRFVAKYKAQFEKGIQALGTDYVVLSSEYLGGGLRSADEIAGFDRWLGQFFEDIQYVIYFRRQEDLLLSAYSQRLKEGIAIGFDAFLAKNSLRDYATIVTRWHKAVSADRLNVRLLERDWLEDGDLIADFANVVGADLSRTSRTKTANESLDLAAQHLLRAVNEAMPHTTTDGRKVNPAKARLRKAILKRNGTHDRRILTEEQTAIVRAANADGNEALRALCFPERAELFPPRSVKPRPETNTEADAVASLAAQILSASPRRRARAKAQGLQRSLWPFAQKGKTS